MRRAEVVVGSSRGCESFRRRGLSCFLGAMLILVVMVSQTGSEGKMP